MIYLTAKLILKSKLRDIKTSILNFLKRNNIYRSKVAINNDLEKKYKDILNDDLIIVRNEGGLGNQLYFFAIARALSIKNGTKVILDNTFFSRPTRHIGSPRNFILDLFTSNYTAIENIEELQYIKKRTNILDMPFEEHFHSFRVNSSRAKKKSAGILKRLNNPVNKSITGWPFSFKIFNKYKDEILNELQPAFKINSSLTDMLKKIDTTNSVSIHIRRGDFLNKDILYFFGYCSQEYYKKAINLVESEIKNPVFFVFSDDPVWVKENLKTTSEFYFVTGGKDYEDFYMMSRCTHNIIANSTFSWWAAYINKNKGKRIFCPEPFTDRIALGHNPEEWTGISKY